MRLIAVTLVVVLVASAAPPVRADDRQVRCESKNYRYRHCSVSTRGWVRLKKQRSDSPCTFRRTWGVDRTGIWVDRGCAADFEIVERHDDREDDGGGGAGKAVAIGGAIAGAVILGAILASRGNDSKETSAEVPEWLEGTFNGFDARAGGNAKLQIERGGRLRYSVRGEETRGAYSSDRVELDNGRTFRVSRSGSDLTLAEEGGSYDAIRFKRER